MKPYAHSQIAALIGKLTAQAKRAAETSDPDAVHDLRVAIRRLSRALRVFAQFFPGKSWKQIRRELSQLMDAAAEIRDRDIAIELLEKAGIPKEARIVATLQKQRQAAAETLKGTLRAWQDSHASQQWKGALEL